MDKEKIRSTRVKYNRPCDECSRRRVRCEQKRPCFRCKEQSILCTDMRGRKRPGPKINFNMNYHQDDTSKNSGNNITAIPYHQILPYLKIYQSWFYGVWPVLSVESLSSEILECFTGNNINNDYSSYVLGLSLCAAVSQRIGFVTSCADIKIPENIHPSHFANEALRMRHLKNHRDMPCINTLLACFFLYCYYGISDGGISSAISYLREALSIAQVLRLHDLNTYEGLESEEIHRMRKIYYLLLITERYICIEDRLPIILDATIPYPTLENEEQPGMLEGFIELVKVFSCPNRQFFENISNSINDSNQMKIFGQLLLGSGNSFSADMIIKIQNLLSKVQITDYMSDIQKINILLSQHWIKSLAWRMAENQHLITNNNRYDSFSMKFPIKIAKDFLNATSHLPLFAFEANGRGVGLKLLEMADSVAMCYLGFTQYNHEFDAGISLEVLERIFELVKNIRRNVTLSNNLYHKIEDILESRSLTVSKRIANLTNEDITDFNSKLSENQILTNCDNSLTSTDIVPDDSIQFMNMFFPEMNLSSNLSLIESEKVPNYRDISRATTLTTPNLRNFNILTDNTSEKNTSRTSSWLLE